MKKNLLLFGYALFLTFSVHSQNVLNKAINNATDQTAATSSGEDEGSTGPIHQKYLNKIVFANDKIARTITSEAKFKTKFKLGETIYGRVYLPKGINTYSVFDAQSGNEYENYFMMASYSASSVFIVAYVDGKLIYGKHGVIKAMEIPKTEEDKFATTFQVPVFLSEEDGGNEQELVDALNKLTNGEHKIKIELWTGLYSVKQSKTPIASSEIILVKDETSSANVGRSFGGLEAGMTDVSLEAKFLKATQVRAKTEGWKEIFSKVKIENQDWEPVRNELTGAILGRVINAWVYATWADGHCTYQSFSYRQSYDGTNYSQATYLEGIGQQEACDCLK
jgi:hypothetical protein